MNSTSTDRSPVILVWGIAGASLGMELAKSLARAGYSKIIGCDISPLAFGHFSPHFQNTYILDPKSIDSSLQRVLERERPSFVLPGGDQVSRIIGRKSELFASHDCRAVGNLSSVVELASDKYEVMAHLQRCGFSLPETRLVESLSSVCDFQLPAVLKPRIDSGGSRGVFVVSTPKELEDRVRLILEKRIPYVIQTYISEEDGEYTIGVLSNTDGTVAGSIVMQRTFQNLLSIHEQSDSYLISSGSSQGFFRRDPEMQKQAEAIAASLGSNGPINIQARKKNGLLMPFEINPRFSASTFLRALSGVNEADLYLQHLITNIPIVYPKWHEGLALRSFDEQFIGEERLQKNVL